MMREELRYITSDGKEFSDKDEALEWEDNLVKEAKDLTLKHDFIVGETVYIVGRNYIWECTFEREEFEIHEDWYADDTVYPSVKLNTLFFKSKTDPDEEEFSIAGTWNLNHISRDLNSLLKICKDK